MVRKQINKRQLSKKQRLNNNRRKSMKLKGGLGLNDSTNIGLPNTYSFANPTVIPQFQLFTFGSPSQYDAWYRLLSACSNHRIPVYILTSGDKVGIIRTLQLLQLANAFVEVLCVQAKLSANPMNISGQHNYHTQNKYQVIQQILVEHGLNCQQGAPIGYLLDDSGFFSVQNLNKEYDIPLHLATEVMRALQTAGMVDRFGVVHPNLNPDNVRQALAETNAREYTEHVVHIIGQKRNSDHLGLCPAIQFVDVLSHGQTPPDFNMQILQANPFYQLNVSKLGLDPIGSPNCKLNFTPLVIIEHMIQLVNSGKVQILFIDFDQTFQIWEGAIPFEHPLVLDIFRNGGAPINVV
jgi:hypothetical protein